MRTFKGSIKTDVQGSDVEFEFEVEDNATQTEIEYEAKQAAFEHVEWKALQAHTQIRTGDSDGTVLSAGDA